MLMLMCFFGSLFDPTSDSLNPKPKPSDQDRPYFYTQEPTCFRVPLAMDFLVEVLKTVRRLFGIQVSIASPTL